MNSAFEVKDSPSEDIPLDEEYLGDFNIEAADDTENGGHYIDDFGTVSEPAENAVCEVQDTENTSSANEDVPSVVVNGEATPSSTPFASPPVKKKRPYVRRSLPKDGPIVKLTKLSPNTIARHTNGEVTSSPMPPPPPPPALGVTEPTPEPFSEAPQPDADLPAQAAAPAEPETAAPSLSASQSLSKKRAVNGPNLLRNKVKKKVVGKSKAITRRSIERAEKSYESARSSLGITALDLPTESNLVECVNCSAVVCIEAAREHVTVCSGPAAPLANDENVNPQIPPAGPPALPSPSLSSPTKGYGTRASAIRSVQSTYGPDACGLCGARGLTDGVTRYLHSHLHHQRHMCLVCGSMHARVAALVKHLQAVHCKEDRYRGPSDVSHLGEVLGRASILICTECGVAIHVLDAEAHSLNCKAMPRFPLPSQVGYHADNASVAPQHTLAITYPSPNAGSAGHDSATPDMPRQKRKYRRRLKPEPPEAEQVQVKADHVPDAEDSALVSPVRPEPAPAPFLSPKEEPMDGVEDTQPTEGKKKAKVLLPSLGSPRGLRTLLPGNKGPPPTPPKRKHPLSLSLSRPSLSPHSSENADPKNLLSGAEEEVAEPAECSEYHEQQNDDAAAPEQAVADEPEPTREPSPAPQLPPRDPIDWKALLEPLLYKLVLRVKKALRKIQLLHCPQCIRYETTESNIEDICTHMRTAHNNHLLRGLGEDTQNRLFAEVRNIYMEDISNEEADQYVDASACRQGLHKFCVEPLDKTYSCDLCSVNELSVKEMVQHLRGAHGFRMYPCLECGQQFKTYGYFISHLVSSSKESIYGCRLCGIVGMVSLYMLQSHLRTHSLCDICHTCFESQTALRKHMFNHQQDSPYACTVCQVSYKNYESLEMHLLWKHGTESKPCPTCQEKTWLCTYHFCPGAPASLAEVVDNPCVCTVCRLEFSKASMLKVHTRLHTGERPHKCTCCKKGFISKKLLAKHVQMKHSEAAVNQAAVAHAVDNEIKAALEKSGLKPKKIQQEILKLIGQQNAAKRSAASSRRVSVEDSPDEKAKSEIAPAPAPVQEPSADVVRTKSSLSDDDDDDEDSLPGDGVATKAGENSTRPSSVVHQLSRIGSSIFDIEDDEDVERKEELPSAVDEAKGEVKAEPVNGDAPEAAIPEKPVEFSLPDDDDDDDDERSASEKDVKQDADSQVKKEPVDAADFLELLASAATSKQAEIPPPPPMPVEPVVVPALRDHDYCSLKEPPPEALEKLNKAKERKAHRHKKHRVKKEPRYVLDLSSSSSDEEDDGKQVNGGQPKSAAGRAKLAKVAQLSDSESSCCPTDCSCSSSSSSSGSDSSSSSSDSSSSDSDSDSSSSSSSSSEDEEEKPKPPVVTTPTTGALSADADDADVDVENNSEPPSSAEESSDSEVGVESDADISVHESDLETSDSDSENKKRLRLDSPKKDRVKKRKKKKKKRRLRDTSFSLDGNMLPVTGNSIDDVINAVASGQFKSKSKKRKMSQTTLGITALPILPVPELPVLLPPQPQPPPTPPASADLRSESKRGRGRKRRTDDLYYYDGEGLEEKTSKPATTKRAKGGQKKPGRTMAKLKFTHNYDALPPPALTPAKTPKASVHPAPSFEDPDRLYCYCRCPYDEESQMIGCDANDCPYEWFHFECVGISEAPEGTYYCPECRLRPKYRAMFDDPFFHQQPPPEQII